jgi:hypothetical protein
VAGKIVVCDEGGGDGSFLDGGKGFVGIFSTPCNASSSSIIPLVWIQSNQADELKAYMNSTR